VITKAEFELRKRQLEDFNRWEREQPPREMTPEQCLAALGALHDILPESTRSEEEDPEKRGVQRMYDLLRLLSVR
jgi:hypothetical protein